MIIEKTLLSVKILFIGTISCGFDLTKAEFLTFASDFCYIEKFYFQKSCFLCSKKMICLLPMITSIAKNNIVLSFNFTLCYANIKPSKNFVRGLHFLISQLRELKTPQLFLVFISRTHYLSTIMFLADNVKNSYFSPCCTPWNHSHKKRKDSLEGSLDRVLFAAELEFPKLLVPRLLQHTSNVNTECAR